MKAVVVIGKNYTFQPQDFQDSFVIAVDRGAVLCLKNKIKPNVAIGDFDSVSSQEFKEIQENSHWIGLNPVKDETDTEEALKLCKSYEDILILGGIGGKRIEHFYANILLLMRYPQARIKDNNSLIFTTEEDKLLKKGEYKFISVFSLSEQSVVSLRGFRYPLHEYSLARTDTIGISNEVLEEVAEIVVHSGRIMVILSKDDTI